MCYLVVRHVQTSELFFFQIVLLVDLPHHLLQLPITHLLVATFTFSIF